MGKFRGKQVKCPTCGKVQYTEGSIYFVCCGKAYPIDQNLYEYEQANTDTSPLKSVTSEKPTEINRNIEFTGGNVEMPEIDDDDEILTCADCGAEVQEGQKFCGNCRKELDWS